MFKILLVLSCLQLINICCDDLFSKFQQHDYEITFTIAEVDHYNATALKYGKVTTFKYNRSLAVVNITWEYKIEFDHSKSQVIIQAYKFLSNEYRTFPLRFQVGLCNAFEHNLAGCRDVLSRCGNLTGCYCKKNQLYHVCNAYPDKSRLPPYIPTGEYKIEATLVNGNSTIAVANVYGKVFRPIKIPS